MKKNVVKLLLCGAAVCAASCVSLGKYEDLESRHAKLGKELRTSQAEVKDMRDENADLVRQNQAIAISLGEMVNAKTECEALNKSLNRQLEDLQHRYDTTMEAYTRKLSGKNRDLAKANDMLAKRNAQLAAKEKAVAEKEAALKQQQTLLQDAQIQAHDALVAQGKAKAALEAKEKELAQIRETINAALVGFTDKGLQVETKDGKVYVSMESKLMFASASWTVSKAGDQAIQELAKVLEEQPELNIMVEGHTDDDVYKGTSAVRDNWDLSVMRATAIVKLILKYGTTIDPMRIEAAGHGPYMPKADNATAEGKAQNRRTEIILTPKLVDVLNVLNASESQEEQIKQEE
ncbi:MAG: OmpA family protein [Bacteroidales bacterium]|nr:OmpA family protein [Candidatus Colimorpha onthohippi]